MASAAMLADCTYTEAPAFGPLVDQYLPINAGRIGGANKVEVIDTHLAPDLKVETAIPANPMLVAALMRLHELKMLPANWDGYGARRVDGKVFRPALALVIEAVQRCQPPTIVALADGGLGLRWDAPGKSLEIDVAASGTVEGYSEGELLGDAHELVAGSDLQAASDLLQQYCRA